MKVLMQISEAEYGTMLKCLVKIDDLSLIYI